MNPAHDRQIELAVRDYGRQRFDTPQDGNAFFERWGLGNRRDRPEQPLERYEYYKRLLSRLWVESRPKFNSMHKGTPFFFLSWSAFDLGDYDRALFFLDSAIAEDARVNPGGYQASPAFQLMSLNGTGGHAAMRVVPELRVRLQNQLGRFGGLTGIPEPAVRDVDDMVGRFVVPMLTSADGRRRNVVSALYTWIFEFQDHCLKLVLRGYIQTSVLPVLFHLFRGGLILETLLKMSYPGFPTLGPILNSPGFKNDFQTPAINGRATDWADIHQAMVDNTLQTALTVTTMLRNFLGHDLARFDEFDNPEIYRCFFEQEVNAILYVISVKYP